METVIKYKNLNLFEVVEPTQEEIQKISKTFKIKEININYSLSGAYYAEFIKEKNYFNFQLVCPIFIKSNLYFERFGIFLVKSGVILIFRENPEVKKIINKTLSSLKNIKNPKNIDFNELFVSKLIFFLVSNYFPLLRVFYKNLNEIENSFEKQSPVQIIGKISKLRRNLIFANTAIKSTLEIITQISKQEISVVKNHQDVWEVMKDRMEFILEKVDDYEKILEGLSRSFESSLSFQINKSIEILTVIQSIFCQQL